MIIWKRLWLSIAWRIFARVIWLLFEFVLVKQFTMVLKDKVCEQNIGTVQLHENNDYFALLHENNAEIIGFCSGI